MVDRLRKSVAELEPPLCPSCAIEMKWYQSALVREAQPATIAHHFHCPNCSRLTETRTIFDPAGHGSGPQKLSRPSQGCACTA